MCAGSVAHPHGSVCDRTVRAEKLPTKRGVVWRPGCSSLLVRFWAAKSSVLDPSVAAAIRALGGPGEADVFAEVARLFLADVPIHLSALGAAIAADEKESVRKIAHRLRGGALEIGAVRMAPVCAAIEHAARAGSLEDAASQADSLGGEFALARRELEQVIQ
jgi:HPt (histidine-containing phosphotransfer) domain-containing protein